MARRPDSLPQPSRTGIARALSKLGFCSRSEGVRLVRAGEVCLNGRRVHDPETPVVLGVDRVEVSGKPVQAVAFVYLMLNKPRGLVTTLRDEQGRDTVYRCLAGAGLPHVSPVGRLDRASEGLLLFTNDTAWADRITAPTGGITKVYHVHVEGLPDPGFLEQLRRGVDSEVGWLAVADVRVLRSGERNCWLEVTLDEGRNRHIRRLLEACGREVLRLVRVAVGPLVLGELEKGAWRKLTADEVRRLGGG